MKEWPSTEKPRERLQTMGSDSLSDRELLAIILGCAGRRGCYNVMDVAGSILATCGSLKGMSEKSYEELKTFPSIGPARAAILKAVTEIAMRYNSIDPAPGTQLKGCNDVASIYMPRLEVLKQEIFRILLLDSRNRIIKDLEISSGSLTESIVHPREVFRAAIRHAACSLILIHNHPSGDPEPSREDIAVTKRLMAVGNLVQITVLDHVIVGNGTYVSFIERGLL